MNDLQLKKKILSRMHRMLDKFDSQWEHLSERELLSDLEWIGEPLVEYL